MNHYLHIGSDDRFILFSPLADMGQGIFTTLPMLIAEELDIDWKRVIVELAPTDEAYANPAFGDQYTADSRAIRGYFFPLRRLGATVRQLLLLSAAQLWNVSRESCGTENGRVVHGLTGRSIAYSDLSERASRLPLPEEVPLKSPEKFRLLGNALPRLDVASKAAGRQPFGIDTVRPRMKFAAIRHVPRRGDAITDFKTSQKNPGENIQIFLLRRRALVAVADDTWLAQRAVENVEWTLDTDDRNFDEPEVLNLAAFDSPGIAVDDSTESLRKTDWDFSREYSVPLLAHTPMEPPACVAEWNGKKMLIWAPVQGPGRAVRAVARELNLPESRIELQQVFMGGSFGRKADVDFVVEAAFIAKRLDVPVKLTWSRSEDIQHDAYRPAYAVRIDCDLDRAGLPKMLRAKLAGASILAQNVPNYPETSVDPTATNNLFGGAYRIPLIERFHVRVQPVPIKVGFWRSVSSSMNTYFTETFINEMAARNEADPLSYRLAMLEGDERAQRVLRTLAQELGPLNKSGQHVGVAFCMPYESYLAQAVEIEMRSASRFKVKKIVTIVDCGFALDPINVRSQIEGGTLFGLTAALFGRITLKQGQVAQANFDTVRMLKLSQTPEMRTHVIQSDATPGGVGELGVPAVAPALTAALHSATGVWQRSLPLQSSGFEIV